jgi:hypothetical protein
MHTTFITLIAFIADLSVLISAVLALWLSEKE